MDIAHRLTTYGRRSHARFDELIVREGPERLPSFNDNRAKFRRGHLKANVTKISSVAAIWAVEGALLLGILTVFVFAWRPVTREIRGG
jgi:hypothetical protein